MVRWYRRFDGTEEDQRNENPNVWRKNVERRFEIFFDFFKKYLEILYSKIENLQSISSFQNFKLVKHKLYFIFRTQTATAAKSHPDIWPVFSPRFHSFDFFSQFFWAPKKISEKIFSRSFEKCRKMKNVGMLTYVGFRLVVTHFQRSLRVQSYHILH